MYILCLIMNPSGLAWQYRTFYSNPPCQIAIRVKLEWLEYKENKTRLVEVKEQIVLISPSRAGSCHSSSWLVPQLELNDFQLGSAQLVTFFPSARNRKSATNEPKFLSFFKFSFMQLNHSFQLLNKPFILYKFIKIIMQLIKIGYNHDTGRKFGNLIVVLKKNSARFQLEN